MLSKRLVGAIYLDRGYDACMKFMQKRILAKMINIDKVAYKGGELQEQTYRMEPEEPREAGVRDAGTGER